MNPISRIPGIRVSPHSPGCPGFLRSSDQANLVDCLEKSIRNLGTCWSAGGESPVARLTKRTRGADADVLICVSVTLPHFFNNFSQKVPDFAASAALRAAIQSARSADSTRFLFR